MNKTDLLLKTVNTVFSLIPQPRPSAEKAIKTKIVAHRGAWDNKKYLENTIPAFQRAQENGVWAIEFDIRWSMDNIPMVHHDRSTQRVFKKNFFIEQNTFETIRNVLPLIPTLDEVVEQLGKKIHFMIELKEKPTTEQSKLLAHLLKPLSCVDDYHFMALHLSHFENLNEFDSKSYVAIGRSDLEKVHQDSLEMKVGALTGQYLLFHKSMQKMPHNLGRKTGVGFPSSKFGLYREINRGFDWIFTNHSVELQKYLSKLVN
ncbi:MAG: hypothetical protein HRT44_12740 [Bdellovibrionales bacterium]|nr:glycerophosphodiester phosphodiesterase [Bdellovibrionales bacterium]NQZ20104.1 hypothetical protein [Bdellovibrionales bacterium]